jgi:hypothetical protein
LTAFYDQLCKRTIFFLAEGPAPIRFLECRAQLGPRPPTYCDHALNRGTGRSEVFLEAPFREASFEMKCKPLILLVMVALAGFPAQAMAGFTLGTAGDFSVLAGSTVTNTGPSIIDGGGVGVSPGSAITGFPPGIVVVPFTTHAGDAVAIQAQNDLTTAYNAAVALVPTQNLTGQDLGGLTLLPGVYFFSSSAQLTGTLTLNNQGDPNALFVFQIGSTLTTATSSSVVTINGGLRSMPGCNVFWQVGSSATLGTTTAFEGHILALTSITLNRGATILDGSALARNGAVTLDSNTITNCVLSSVPEPATMTLTLIGGALLGLAALRKRLRECRSRDEDEKGSQSFLA